MKQFSAKAAMGMVDDLVLQKHKETVFNVLRSVVAKSPVDEGTYKANHKVNDSGYENKSYGGSASTSSAQDAINKGESQIALIKTGYAISTVSNDVPYAGVIENGGVNRPALGIYRLALEDAKNK